MEECFRELKFAPIQNCIELMAPHFFCILDALCSVYLTQPLSFNTATAADPSAIGPADQRPDELLRKSVSHVASFAVRVGQALAVHGGGTETTTAMDHHLSSAPPAYEASLRNAAPSAIGSALQYVTFNHCSYLVSTCQAFVAGGGVGEDDEQRQRRLLSDVIKLTALLQPLLRSTLRLEAAAGSQCDFETALSSVIGSIRHVAAALWPSAPTASGGRPVQRTRAVLAREKLLQWGICAAQLVDVVLFDAVAEAAATASVPRQTVASSSTGGWSVESGPAHRHTATAITVRLVDLTRKSLLDVFTRSNCATELIVTLMSAIEPAALKAKLSPSAVSAWHLWDCAVSLAVKSSKALLHAVGTPEEMPPDDEQVIQNFISCIVCEVLDAVRRCSALLPATYVAQIAAGNFSGADPPRWIVERKKLFTVCATMDHDFFARCMVYYTALHSRCTENDLLAPPQGRRWTKGQIDDKCSVLLAALLPVEPEPFEADFRRRCLLSFLNYAATLQLPAAEQLQGSANRTSTKGIDNDGGDDNGGAVSRSDDEADVGNGGTAHSSSEPPQSTGRSLTDALLEHSPPTVTALFLILLSRYIELYFPHVNDEFAAIALRLLNSSSSGSSSINATSADGLAKMRFVSCVVPRYHGEGIHFNLCSPLVELLRAESARDYDEMREDSNSEAVLNFIQIAHNNCTTTAAAARDDAETLALAEGVAFRILSCAHSTELRVHALRALQQLEVPTAALTASRPPFDPRHFITVEAAGALVTPHIVKLFCSAVSPDCRARTHAAALLSKHSGVVAGRRGGFLMDAECTLVGSIAAAFVHTLIPTKATDTHPSTLLLFQSPAQLFDSISSTVKAAAAQSSFSDGYWKCVSKLLAVHDESADAAAAAADPEPTSDDDDDNDNGSSGTGEDAAESNYHHASTSIRMLLVFINQLERQLQLRRTTGQQQPQQGSPRSWVQFIDALRLNVIATAFALLNSSVAMTPITPPTASSAIAAATVVQHGLQRLADLRLFAARAAAAVPAAKLLSIWWEVEKVALSIALAIIHIDTAPAASHRIVGVAALVKRVNQQMVASKNVAAAGGGDLSSDLTALEGSGAMFSQVLSAVGLVAACRFEEALDIFSNSIFQLKGSPNCSSLQRFVLQVSIHMALHSACAVRCFDVVRVIERCVRSLVVGAEAGKAVGSSSLDAAHFEDRLHFLILEAVPAFDQTLPLSVTSISHATLPRTAFKGPTYRFIILTRQKQLTDHSRGVGVGVPTQLLESATGAMASWGDVPGLVRLEHGAPAEAPHWLPSSGAAQPARVAESAAFAVASAAVRGSAALLRLLSLSQSPLPPHAIVDASNEQKLQPELSYFAHSPLSSLEFDSHHGVPLLYALVKASIETGNKRRVASLLPHLTDDVLRAAATVQLSFPEVPQSDAIECLAEACSKAARRTNSAHSLHEGFSTLLKALKLLESHGGQVPPGVVEALSSSKSEATAGSVISLVASTQVQSRSTLSDGLSSPSSSLLHRAVLGMASCSQLPSESRVLTECNLQLASWCGSAYESACLSRQGGGSAPQLLYHALTFISVSFALTANDAVGLLINYKAALMAITFLLALGKAGGNGPALLAKLRAAAPPSCWRGVAPQLASTLHKASPVVQRGFAGFIRAMVEADGVNSPLIYLLAVAHLDSSASSSSANRDQSPASTTRPLKELVLDELSGTLRGLVVQNAEFILALRKVAVFPFEAAAKVLKVEERALGKIIDAYPADPSPRQARGTAGAGRSRKQMNEPRGGERKGGGERSTTDPSSSSGGGTTTNRSMQMRWASDHYPHALQSTLRELQTLLQPLRVQPPAKEEQATTTTTTTSSTHGSFLSLVERRFFEVISPQLSLLESEVSTMISEGGAVWESPETALTRLTAVRSKLRLLRSDVQEFEDSFESELKFVSHQRHDHGHSVCIGSLTKTVPQILSMCSSTNCASLVMPTTSGLCPRTPSAGVPRIIRVANSFGILQTKSKPRELAFFTEDGRAHSFLLKGRDDIHLDERVLQIYDFANLLFTCSPQARGLEQHLGTFHAVPLGAKGGLVQMVPGVSPIFLLHVRHFESSAPSPPTKDDKAPPQRYLPSEQFYAKLEQVSGDVHVRERPRLEWNAEAVKRTVLELMRSAPRDLLARELWLGPPQSPSAESSSLSGHLLSHSSLEAFSAYSWYHRFRTYTVSVATSSAMGWIVGLGDRHLGNILVDFLRGDVLHIDYNVCFERGAQLVVPERVPFRMTPVLQTALGPHGVEGSFMHTMAATLQLLQENRVPILQLLHTFVHDPLWDWAVAAQANLKIAPSTAEHVSLCLSKLAGLLDHDQSSSLTEFIALATKLLEAIRCDEVCEKMAQVAAGQAQIDAERNTLREVEAELASAAQALADCQRALDANQQAAASCHSKVALQLRDVHGTLQQHMHFLRELIDPTSQLCSALLAVAAADSSGSCGPAVALSRSLLSHASVLRRMNCTVGENEDFARWYTNRRWVGRLAARHESVHWHAQGLDVVGIGQQRGIIAQCVALWEQAVWLRSLLGCSVAPPSGEGPSSTVQQLLSQAAMEGVSRESVLAAQALIVEMRDRILQSPGRRLVQTLVGMPMPSSHCTTAPSATPAPLAEALAALVLSSVLCPLEEAARQPLPLLQASSSSPVAEPIVSRLSLLHWAGLPRLCAIAEPLSTLLGPSSIFPLEGLIADPTARLQYQALRGVCLCALGTVRELCVFFQHLFGYADSLLRERCGIKDHLECFLHLRRQQAQSCTSGLFFSAMERETDILPEAPSDVLLDAVLRLRDSFVEASAAVSAWAHDDDGDFIKSKLQWRFQQYCETLCEVHCAVANRSLFGHPSEYDVFTEILSTVCKESVEFWGGELGDQWLLPLLAQRILPSLRQLLAPADQPAECSSVLSRAVADHINTEGIVHQQLDTTTALDALHVYAEQCAALTASCMRYGEQVTRLAAIERVGAIVHTAVEAHSESIRVFHWMHEEEILKGCLACTSDPTNSNCTTSEDAAAHELLRSSFNLPYDADAPSSDLRRSLFPRAQLIDAIAADHSTLQKGTTAIVINDLPEAEAVIDSIVKAAACVLSIEASHAAGAQAPPLVDLPELQGMRNRMSAVAQMISSQYEGTLVTLGELTRQGRHLEEQVQLQRVGAAAAELRCRDARLRIQSGTEAVLVGQQGLLLLASVDSRPYEELKSRWEALEKNTLLPLKSLLQEQFLRGDGSAPSSSSSGNPTATAAAASSSQPPAVPTLMSREVAACAERAVELHNLLQALMGNCAVCLPAIGQSWFDLQVQLRRAPIAARELLNAAARIFSIGRRMELQFSRTKLEALFERAQAADSPQLHIDVIPEAKRLVAAVADKLSFREPAMQLVGRLIGEAISIDNLAVMFEGWTSWL